jgi:hypothetical protein
MLPALPLTAADPFEYGLQPCPPIRGHTEQQLRIESCGVVMAVDNDNHRRVTAIVTVCAGGRPNTNYCM